VTRLSAGSLTSPFVVETAGGGLDQSTKEGYFPNSIDFQGIVHPGVGHNINYSYNATGAYGVMLDYLNKHGL